LQTRNVIPVPDFSGINLSGNPLIKSKRATARLSVGATLCGRPKTTIGKWQLIIKNSSTLRGEDKGEGGITTLPIAGC